MYLKACEHLLRPHDPWSRDSGALLEPRLWDFHMHRDPANHITFGGHHLLLVAEPYNLHLSHLPWLPPTCRRHCQRAHHGLHPGECIVPPPNADERVDCRRERRERAPIETIGVKSRMQPSRLEGNVARRHDDLKTHACSRDVDIIARICEISMAMKDLLIKR